MELVECVPNFSEGKNPEVIEAVASAARSIHGVRLLDTHSDPDHNRSVLTYVVPPSHVVDAAFAVVQAAVQHIDLRRHTGVHPRIGALDVFPFVPLGEVTMTHCIAYAHELGERVANSLHLPVYFYEEAAKRPERRALESIRRSGFEEVAAAIGHDDEYAPDLGPPHLHPTAGAIVIGARHPLIAFNVYLATDSLQVAKTIARRLRASSGGLTYVKALGLELAEARQTQVSMNLTNFRASSLVTIMDIIRAEASRHGVSVTHSEVVGLVPLEALLDAAGAFLQLPSLHPQQILEYSILSDEASPT